MLPFFAESVWITKSFGAELFEFPDLAVFKVIIFLIAGRIYYNISLNFFLLLESSFGGVAMCCIVGLCYLVRIVRA